MYAFNNNEAMNQTPINYNDPNDPRNYAMSRENDQSLPGIQSGNNLNSNGLVYHDFDYVGYANEIRLQA